MDGSPCHSEVTDTADNPLTRTAKRKAFRGLPGVQSDVKKAVVPLEVGHRIDVTTGL